MEHVIGEDSGCDSCRWQYIRMDHEPCNRCCGGSEYEKSALEGQDMD